MCYGSNTFSGALRGSIIMCNEEGIPMMARIVLAAAAFGLIGPSLLRAADVLVPVIQGSVFVDGRPINRIVQIQLEAHNSAIVATAFTLDPPRFTFRNVTLSLNDTYILSIRETGFTELRYPLNAENFVRDSSQESLAHFTGILVLNLERLPPENGEDTRSKTGPKTVGVRQLQARIPDEARKEYNAALDSFAKGNNELGREHLEKSIELAPDYYEALNKLGVEYLRADQYRKAEILLTRACALNPYDPVPLTNLGILYMHEADSMAPVTAGAPAQTAAEPLYKKAVDMFEKALDIIPLNPLANFHLGLALYKTGAYERAESLLIQSLKLDGQLFEARLTLVYLYLRQQRYDVALEQITLCLEANPTLGERERVEALKTQIQKVRPKE
jgi:tetratricopeptide (TPR) repeat protein